MQAEGPAKVTDLLCHTTLTVRKGHAALKAPLDARAALPAN